MTTPQIISRRKILGSVGLAAAGLTLPGLAGTANAALDPREDEPRLPLLILDRVGLFPDREKQILGLSPQIKIAKNGQTDRDPLPNAQVIFGGIGANRVSAAAKTLRWIQSSGAGVESICFPEFVRSDVLLTNAQGCCGPQIAEHVFGLLFALTRVIAHQARQRKWGAPPEPIELRGMTMGIIGLGGIGREVARRAKAMDMHVIAVDAEPMYEVRFAMADEIRLVDEGLEALLKRADVVVMAAPHTARTRGMLGEKQFALMKRGSWFINVSRGKTVKTDALIAALKDGTLAGVGLDVTDPEPLPDGHKLWSMPNAVITSHIAGRSQFQRERVQTVFSENVHRYINRLPLLNIVDKQKGY